MSDINKSTLSLLGKDKVPAIPNRAPKILQFGGGNFLRGYIDWMVEILNEQTDFDGSVIIVKPTERGDYKKLKDQNGLYHLATNGIKDGQLVEENKLITCISDIIHSYHEWGKFLKTAEISSLRFIVSNTTESGIRFSESDQFSDATPKEFPGKLAKWLHHRFEHFGGEPASGCIFLPCELIESNGTTLKKAILDYARLWSFDSAFTDWINEHNIFCNTLVDRIVPGFPSSRSEEIFQTLGFRDNLLVDAEPYHIFVIQADKDITSELPFHKTDLNVVFTDDISPYRKIKVRILNGAHTSMVPVGYLSGLESVREAVKDPSVGQFIRKILSDEISPTIDDQTPEAIAKYTKDTIDRFLNPSIHHKLISISLNSISKFKTRLLPSLIAYYELNQTIPERIVFALSSLIWFYRGYRNDEKIPLNDNPEVIAFFKDIWLEVEEGVRTLDDLVKVILSKKEYWEQDLNEIKGLQESITQHLENFKTKGYKLPEDLT